MILMRINNLFVGLLVLMIFQWMLCVVFFIAAAEVFELQEEILIKNGLLKEQSQEISDVCIRLHKVI